MLPDILFASQGNKMRKSILQIDEIETVQFIAASKIFTGLEHLWMEFNDSNPPFHWGGNNRTLVSAEAILNHLDSCANVTERSVEFLRARLLQISPALQLNIDLET